MNPYETNDSYSVSHAYSDDTYSAADACADEAQDAENALHAEALAEYSIHEVLEAIIENSTEELMILIRMGDKRAGEVLAELIEIDLEEFCKNYIESAPELAEFQAKSTSYVGGIL